MRSALETTIAFAVTASMISWSGAAISADRSGLAALQGAWLEQSMSCKDVYIPKQSRMVFRKDVSLFAPAILVTGPRLATPGAVCHIGSVSRTNDRQTIHLSCATSIATSPVKAIISFSKDGALYRYTDETDNVGSRYVRCSQ